MSTKDAPLLVSIVGLVLLSSLLLLSSSQLSSSQLSSSQLSSSQLSSSQLSSSQLSSSQLSSSQLSSSQSSPVSSFIPSAIVPEATPYPPFAFALSELQRITIDDASLVNALGASVVDNVNVNQQVNISSTMTNNQDITQKFVYIVQIKDDQGLVVSLSWIGGESAPAKTFTSSLSWTPDKLGQYTIDIFVWEDLVNHNALSEKITLQINVS